ncbi:MAG TPA: signal peptidase I [Bacillota bacterium]|nr:signal peptidase I [Bacillota bacterium]
MSKLSKKAKSVLEWVEVIVISIVLALLINLFVIQPIKVDGRSMLPTLHDKDFVIISRLGRTFNLDVDYGDIVVVDNRVDEKRTLADDLSDINIFSKKREKNLWIKRVVGLPGDDLEVRDGLLYRNGQICEEPYLNEPFMMEPLMRGDFIRKYSLNESGKNTYTVPEDHIFVMGDNRNNSVDSRYEGAIPTSNIKGVMAFDVNKLFRKK